MDIREPWSGPAVLELVAEVLQAKAAVSGPYADAVQGWQSVPQ